MISVLYVDDEPDLLILGKLFLERTGKFVVETCTSADEGIRRIETRSFDIILSDYQMPGTDGISFLQQVRSRFGDLPFILFTGRGREEVVIKAIDSGVDFYLQKGGDPRSQFAELAHKLRIAVERNQAVQALEKSEERMRIAIEAANEGLWEINLATGLTYLSPRGCRMLGYSPEEMAAYDATSWRDLLHPDDREKTDRMVAAYNQGEIDVIELEQRILMKSGEWRWVLSRGRAVERDSQGRPLRYAGTHTDISEQKKAESELQESRDFLGRIYSSVREGIAVIDAGTHQIISINPAGAAMIGASEEEIVGRTCHTFICPSQKGTCPITDLHQVVDNAERILLTADGKEIPIIKHVVPFHFQGRDCLLETFFDNSQRKQAQETLFAAYEENRKAKEELWVQYENLSALRDALQEREAQFRNLVETTPDTVWEVTAEGVMVYASPQCRSMIGYTPQELIGRNVMDLFSPEGSAIIRSALAQRDLRDPGLLTFDAPAIHQDGSIRILNIRSFLLRDPDGKVTGIRGVACDVTERTRYLEELTESETRFNQVAAHAGEWIWEIDETGMYQYCSQAVSAILGFEPGEITGRKYFWDFFLPGMREQVAHDAWDIITSREPFKRYINHNRRKDGEVVILETSGTPVYDQQGVFRGYRGVDMDVTAGQKAERAMRQINLHLSILSSLSRHEYMNLIREMDESLADAETACPDTKIRECLFPVSSRLQILKEMVEFTRVYQDIGAHEPSWQEIGSILPVHGVPPSVRLHHETGDWSVFADPMLRNVFSNLLDNSLRHGETVTVVRVRVQPDDERLKIVWEDDGVGIPHDEKEYLFDRGFGKNNGIGLFLVREILSLTGISIRETGEPGSGARFEITVPAGQFRRSGQTRPEERQP